MATFNQKQEQDLSVISFDSCNELRPKEQPGPGAGDSSSCATQVAAPAPAAVVVQGGGSKKKKKSHYRVDSTASAVAYSDLTKNAVATAGNLSGSTLPPSNSQPSHAFTRRHKRTKSAGNYSAKDLTLFITTGLYAHNPMAVSSVANYLDQSLEHGFDPVARSALTRHSSSDSDVSKREPCIRERKNIHTHTLNYKLVHRSQSEINGLPEDTIGHSNGPGDDFLKDCGISSYRPAFLQKFATIQVFVLLCCVLVTINQALSSGYFNSVITTIEKRFDIPSRMTGIIASTFEIGNLVTVIFVSYFGTHRHIPKWIGRGVVVTGIGSIVFSLAHFIDQSTPFDKFNISSSHDDNMCHIPTPYINSPMAERASHFIVPPLPGVVNSQCKETGSYRSPHLIIFILAMILIGCGGTPIFTLGTIYIDDHVRSESSSMYIGCMYSMVAFGLVVGFLMGGYFLRMHENSFGTGVIPRDIYPGHPRFIGGWWVGFVILGLLLILISLPFFAFPKQLPKKKSKKVTHLEHKKHIQSVTLNNTEKCHLNCPETMTTISSECKMSCKDDLESDAGAEYGRNIKQIPRCMWNLLSNPVYIVTCLGSCMELSIVSGFLVFLPKYLETQFTIGKSEANLFAGGIAVPGACIGIFLGGYLLKRFQLGIKGAIQFVLFFNLVCMGLYTGLYFLGCDNMKMAGTTLPYYNSSSFDVPFQVNLTAECNMGCDCSPNDIEPICGRNGVTYFSPCHAGCQVSGGPRHFQNYSNCACITENAPNFEIVNGTSVTLPIATAGPCPQMCKAMVPFLIILFIVTLVVSITQMPLLMITLRSVREEERAFALGMQFVIFRIFGYIPSPIVFGNVIDSTCLYSKANCGKAGGFCLIYNIEHFRLRYIGVCSALKVAAGLLFFLDWVLVSYTTKMRRHLHSSIEVDVREVISSMASLDNLPKMDSCGLDEAAGDRIELLEAGLDSDYNSANDGEEESEHPHHFNSAQVNSLFHSPASP